MWARCRGVAEGVAGVDDKHAGGAGGRATCALTLTAVGRGGSNFGGEVGGGARDSCRVRAAHGGSYAIAFPQRSRRPRVESWTSAGHSPAPRRQARGEGCRHIRLHHRCFMTELQRGAVRGRKRKKVCLNENAVAGARGEGSQLMQARTCCYENSQKLVPAREGEALGAQRPRRCWEPGGGGEGDSRAAVVWRRACVGVALPTTDQSDHVRGAA